jgi:Protocatechuate 3,4-dioxygenase beta subunit N terminal
MSFSLIQYEGKGPGESLAAFRRHEPGTQPDYLYPAYHATRLLAPSQPLILLPYTLSEVTGPVFGHSDIQPNENDLTLQHAGGRDSDTPQDCRSSDRSTIHFS